MQKSARKKGFITVLKQILVVLTALLAMSSVTAETPRFRGPSGDGRFAATGLVDSWPEDGPPVAWVAEGLGSGYSSVSAAGGSLYVTGMQADHIGRLYLLNLEGAKTGEIIYGPETTDDQATGPRATPTIDGDRAYLLSGLGVVYALDLANETVLWRVDILERFEGQNIQWTLAESLLLDGDNIICTPGGKLGVVVALNKMTGDAVWAMTELQDKTSYCSPVLITHNGRRILVTMTAQHVLGMDPDTGALLWSHGHRTDYDIHAVSPVYEKGLLYYSSGYGSGGGALRLSEDGGAVTQAWTDQTLDCQHHGVVLVDGYLYGTAHRRSGMVCLEMATGRVMWSEREVTQGGVVYADGMLYVYEGPRIGRVTLVKPNPEALEIRGRVSVTDGTDRHWAHPTIAHGMLFIRRGDALVAYDIRKQ